MTHSRFVRGLAISLRAVHELFWALVLIQIFGIGPLAGILSIALPYSGIFAKVFAEMIEEADRSAERALPAGTSQVSAFAYARLPDLAARMKTYALYRLECGLRSTLVLGFIGLPTIGFHLESYFKQATIMSRGAARSIFRPHRNPPDLGARGNNAASDRGEFLAAPSNDRQRPRPPAI